MLAFTYLYCTYRCFSNKPKILFSKLSVVFVMCSAHKLDTLQYIPFYKDFILLTLLKKFRKCYATCFKNFFSNNITIELKTM